MANESLEAKFKQIETAAQDVGSHILRAVLRSQGQEGYRVNLDIDSFLVLLKSCKPRIIYAFSNPFDAREGLTTELLAEDVDEDEEADHDGGDAQNQLSADPRVKALLKEFVRHDGKVESIFATVVVEGILHSVYEQAPWASAFDNAVSELKTVIEAERASKEDAEDNAVSEHIREHAKTLCAHPKFVNGRPSKEKRLYLAESLFPHLSEMEIYSVVSEAANMQWLASE